MALFGMFGAKPKEENVMIPMEIEAPSEENTAENAPDNEEEKKEDQKQLITILWGTGMPIDVIYNFIHKNYEEEGFQDALVNSDITYRDAKERIIRNDLEMLFQRIILRYNCDIREIEVLIESARQAFAIAAASRLEARRKTYEEHLLEIKEMKDLLEANDPKMTTMIESYRRGFLKGMAALSQKFIDNN